jgi:hypothetical protein
MFTANTGTATLQVSAQGIIFLHDATSNTEGVPDESQVVYPGTLTLSFPKPRQVQSISVRMVRVELATSSFAHPHER